MKSFFLAFLFAFTFLACQTKETKPILTKKVELKGNWQYEGFGKALIIGDSIINRFHTSTAGNTSLSDTNRKDFFEYYTLEVVSNDTILIKDGVKTFELTRTDTEYFKGVNEELANDPEYNFEILWNTFNEQYVYFEERNIDWDAFYKKYRPQVNSKTTSLELYKVCHKMLSEIKDGHISIDIPEELENEINEEELGENDEATNNLGKRVKDQIIEKYLAKPNKFNRGELTWGMVNNNVAYMQIKNMVAMAHYPIADSLSRDAFWEQWWANLNKAKNHHNDISIGAKYMMDSIVSEINGLRALIIDLRFNGGGFDEASVEILNHLVNSEIDICTKKARKGLAYTQKQTMTLAPASKTFKGKVYVLTSHLTASAAELLVLGSKELPNSEIIGATTEGIFSDILHKKLPNGWTFGLSNLVYESMDGVSYENIGIEADFKINYPREDKEFYTYLIEDLKDGDDAIERVIAKSK